MEPPIPSSYERQARCVRSGCTRPCRGPPPQAGSRPRLGEPQLAVLRDYGTEHAVAIGDVLFADGDETYDLIVLLDGETDIVGNYGRPGEVVTAMPAFSADDSPPKRAR